MFQDYRITSPCKRNLRDNRAFSIPFAENYAIMNLSWHTVITSVTDVLLEK